MGEETQKWWKSIVETEADQRVPGAPQSVAMNFPNPTSNPKAPPNPTPTGTLSPILAADPTLSPILAADPTLTPIPYPYPCC